MTAGPRAGRSRKERCGGRQTDCSCSDLPRALCARTHIHIIIIIISFTFPMNCVNLWVSRLRFSLYISELILLPSSRPFFTEMCWIVKLPKCRKLPPPCMGKYWYLALWLQYYYLYCLHQEVHVTLAHNFIKLGERSMLKKDKLSC